MTLTPRQQAVLDFIIDYRHRTGMSPTMQEIADGFGFSKVTIFEHIGALEKKRLIRRKKHAARSIEVIGPETERRRLVFPVLGWVKLTR